MRLRPEDAVPALLASIGARDVPHRCARGRSARIQTIQPVRFDEVYCEAAMPTIFWQCRQQKTRWIVNQPRLTSISFSTFFSQWGHTGVMFSLSIFTMFHSRVLFDSFTRTTPMFTGLSPQRKRAAKQSQQGSFFDAGHASRIAATIRRSRQAPCPNAASRHQIANREPYSTDGHQFALPIQFLTPMNLRWEQRLKYSMRDLLRDVLRARLPQIAFDDTRRVGFPLGACPDCRRGHQD